MKDQDFAAWCETATKKIRYGPDRQAVSAELRAHMEDKYDALIAHGVTPEEAAAKTLESMGSAREIAPQLGRIHRPWLGYLYSITMLIAITVMVPAVVLLGYNGLRRLEAVLTSDNVASFANYEESGYYCEPNASIYGEGYYIRIPEAAVVPEEERLYYRMEVFFGPWMDGFVARDYFWAVDSQGNYYRSLHDYERGSPGINYRSGMISSSGIQVTTYTLDYFDCDAQWVELHYDRDGRDFVLRIDLTGGEGK